MDFKNPFFKTQTTPAEEENIWAKFGDYLGGEKFAAFGKSMQGAGALASLGTNLYGLFQSHKALKMQKKAFENAQRQQDIENERYAKREKERDEATALVMEGAGLLDTSRQ